MGSQWGAHTHALLLAQSSPCVFFPGNSANFGRHCEAGFCGGDGRGGCQCAFLYADVEADFRDKWPDQKAPFGCAWRGCASMCVYVLVGGGVVFSLFVFG